MKSNTVFKRAYNRGLARLPAYAIASDIGSEPSWSQALAVSRTTVRAIFSAFAASGLIAYDGRRKALLRQPVPADFYAEGETEQGRRDRRKAVHAMDPAWRLQAGTANQRA